MADYGFEIIEKGVRERLNNELARIGFLFRLHSRIKDSVSIKEKKVRKSYTGEKKMQDILGFRITTYFCDDIYIIVEMCKKLFEMVELVYDEPNTEIFRPLRKNMICRVPVDYRKIFDEVAQASNLLDFVDNTFEIQFRTTLSEGWHEVDHSLRYKCQDDWKELKSESRMLNGIYATLETSDQALVALFEDIAYSHYKKKSWEAMMRNKFRMRFILQPMSERLVSIFNEDQDVGRAYFKLNRTEIIESFIRSNIVAPLSFDFLIYYINFFFLKNDSIVNMTPDVLVNQFENLNN